MVNETKMVYAHLSDHGVVKNVRKVESRVGYGGKEARGMGMKSISVFSEVDNFNT